MSVEHLKYADEETVAALAAAGTVAVLRFDRLGLCR
jgi:imidazolonepropionase-like amidohydrolase